FGPNFDRIIKNYDDQNKSYESAIQKMISKPIPAPPSIKTVKDAVDADPTLAVEASVRLQDFFGCAKHVLPKLKMLLKLRTVLKSDDLDTQNDIRAIETILNLTRGDGTHITPTGVVCGAALGEAGFETPVEPQEKQLFEIKAMQAAAARSGDE